MKKFSKKLGAIILSLALILVIAPVTAIFAGCGESNPPASVVDEEDAFAKLKTAAQYTLGYTGDFMVTQYEDGNKTVYFYDSTVEAERAGHFECRYYEGADWYNYGLNDDDSFTTIIELFTNRFVELSFVGLQANNVEDFKSAATENYTNILDMDEEERAATTISISFTEENGEYTLHADIRFTEGEDAYGDYNVYFVYNADKILGWGMASGRSYTGIGENRAFYMQGEYLEISYNNTITEEIYNDRTSGE